MSEDCNFGLIHLKLPDHRISVSVFKSFTAIAAVLFNYLVLLSVWKTPSLHKPSYILIANLALTDFVIGAIVGPLAIITNIAALLNWTDVFCNVWLGYKAIAYWMAAESLYTLTVISVDRLLAIRLKTKYRSVVTLKRITAVLTFWWIGGGIFTLSCLLFTSLPVNRLVIVAAVYQAVLMFILIPSYSMAFHLLKKLSSSVSSNQILQRTGTGGEQQQNFNVSKYRRSLHTMLLVVFCVLLFYSPYVCSAILTEITVKDGQSFGQDASSVLMYKLLTASEVIVELNSSVNPLLYLWRIKNLRQAAVTTLRRIFHKRLTDNQEQEQQT